MKETHDIYGIQELYRPADGEAEIDIVAIHGLNGDAIKTWTSERDNICWLSHPNFIPKYIKRARVLTWGYNANITSLTGRTTSSDRILQHAQTLVAQLHADRDLEDANERPIIFICHSLGGIIVKRALAYSASRSASKISHLHTIFTCTFAILFFGTPHNGSSKTRLLSSLLRGRRGGWTRIARWLLGVSERRVFADSETLQNITDQFTPLMSNFRIFFFWEQEKTDLRYSKDYIVEETSAAPILDDTERSGIAADHRGMVKFRRNTEQGFRTAVAALRRYCLLAPQVIKGRLVQSAETLHERRRFEAMEMLGEKNLLLDRTSGPAASVRENRRSLREIELLESSYGDRVDHISGLQSEDPVLISIPSLRAG